MKRTSSPEKQGGSRHLHLVSASQVARVPEPPLTAEVLEDRVLQDIDDPEDRAAIQPPKAPEPAPSHVQASIRALTTLTDAQLVGVARSADKKAFEVLYR